MSKSSRTEQVVARLQAAGYVPAGCTQSYKAVTKDSYPLAGAVIQGRRRFELPGTDRRATVGARTTCLYRVEDRGPVDFRNFQTADLDAISAALATEATA